MSMGAMSMVYPGGATAATAATAPAFIVLSAVQVCSSILCWLQPTSRLVIMVQEPSLCIFSVGGSFLLNTSCAHGSFLSHRGTPSYHPLFFWGIFHEIKINKPSSYWGSPPFFGDLHIINIDLERQLADRSLGSSWVPSGLAQCLVEILIEDVYGSLGIFTHLPRFRRSFSWGSAGAIDRRSKITGDDQRINGGW